MEEEGKDQQGFFPSSGASPFQFWYAMDTLRFHIPLNMSQTDRYGYTSVV